MKAETASSGCTPNPSISNARDRRVKLAGETIDRIDIARHLIMAEPVSCRLALAMRLLRTTVDDVAELAGIEDEDARKRREAEAIRRAVVPLPKAPTLAEGRAELVKLLLLLSFGLAAMAAIGAAFFKLWWS